MLAAIVAVADFTLENAELASILVMRFVNVSPHELRLAVFKVLSSVDAIHPHKKSPLAFFT